MKNKKPTEFCREYLGTWGNTDQEPLAKLAQQYHERTEAFDKLHCSGTSERGSAIPMNGHEHAVINRNAQEVFDELCDEAARLGCTPKQFRAAISDFRHS